MNRIGWNAIVVAWGCADGDADSSKIESMVRIGCNDGDYGFAIGIWFSF